MTAAWGGAIVKLAKTDNASGATRAKVSIRDLVLAAVEPASVFDAFAGEGHMHDAVWHKAAHYTGCDERFFKSDSRLAFVADNRRVLRTLDLARFNVFDLDAYGSPWEQAFIVARRRTVQPGERIGLIITEGTGMKMKMGGMSKALTLLSGVRPKPGLGKGDIQDDVVSRALLKLAELMHVSIERRWQATGKVGSRMIYCGLVLQGLPYEAT